MSSKGIAWLSILVCLTMVTSCKSAAEKQLAQDPAFGPIADAGMVVTAHPEASAIAAQVLAYGGSAIDAAVAAQFALAVCYPIAGNIGGGGFMIFRREDGIALTLDFRETAPSAASVDMFLDESGKVVPGASTMGHLSVGVPGVVAGMWKAHERFGIRPWSELIQPAVDLATNGFAITANQAKELNDEAELFSQLNPGNSYLRQDKPWNAGDMLRQTDLAATLQRIADQGPEGFYRGETARAIIAEMQRGSGLIDSADLAEYEAIWRAPIVTRYDSFTVIAMAPPSSGGIALSQLLGMLQPYPLREWGHNSSRTIHLMTEAERRVYADRTEHLGDPDFWDVPQDELLDPSYLLQRMADVNLTQATRSNQIQPGVVKSSDESPQTTHFSIVDRGGNAVSITTTLNDAFGSKIFVTGAGFLLNDEMDYFSAKPGVPNLYGLLGGQANAIAPGKRMLSSMTPIIAEKKGKLYAVIGTPGGSTIITSVLQTFLNLVEFDMTMQQAVAAPRVHHQWFPDSIRTDPGALADSARMQLTRMGHRIYSTTPIGRVDAIRVLPDGRFEGGADPRGDDRAIGVKFNRE